MNPPNNDLIDRICELSPDDRLHGIRANRAKVKAATQGSHEALFDPSLAGLSLDARLLVAMHACRLTPSPVLAAWYREQATSNGCDASAVAAIDSGAIDDVPDLQLREILHFTTTLVERPIEGDKRALHRLPTAGLSTPAVVALAQLIAYLSYQTRLVAGLGAMRAAMHTSPAPAQPDTGAPIAATAVLAPSPIRIDGFTNESLEWSAWLDVIELTAATPEQLAVLEESHPKAKISDYYRLLVHQPRILRERSAAFNAIMYAPGGLPRAERELASTVVSKINGCVYCASVHAQRFEQLARRNDAIVQVFTDPTTAGTTERERAIIAFSIALTRAPQRIGAVDIDSLRIVGLDDAGILDLLHSVAIFAWANRLMLNLGEPRPAGGPG